MYEIILLLDHSKLGQSFSSDAAAALWLISFFFTVYPPIFFFKKNISLTFHLKEKKLWYIWNPAVFPPSSLFWSFCLTLWYLSKVYYVIIIYLLWSCQCELFFSHIIVDMLTEDDEKFVEFGIGGLCNGSLGKCMSQLVLKK